MTNTPTIFIIGLTIKWIGWIHEDKQPANTVTVPSSKSTFWVFDVHYLILLKSSKLNDEWKIPSAGHLLQCNLLFNFQNTFITLET